MSLTSKAQTIKTQVGSIKETLGLSASTPLEDIDTSVELTVEAVENVDVFRVSSTAERDLLPAKEGDICVVYSDTQTALSNPPIAGDYIFPNTVVFTTAIGEEHIILAYTSEDRAINVILADDGCTVEFDDIEDTYRADYTSNDGLTYTKTSGASGFTLPSDTWTDTDYNIDCSKFILLHTTSFSGIFKYTNNSWSYLDIGVNTTSSDIILNKLAYTNTGIVTGINSGSNVNPNIFVQTAEPTIKDGVWVQTDKTYQRVVIDEDVYAQFEWTNDKLMTPMPSDSGLGYSIFDEDDVFLYNNSKRLYKYNISTKEWTKLGSSYSSGTCRLALSPDYVVVFGSSNSMGNGYYDLFNRSTGQLIGSYNGNGGSTYAGYNMSLCIVNNKLYSFSIYNNTQYARCIDLSTKEVTYLPTPSTKFFGNGNAVYVGNSLIYICCGNYIYSFNIETNEYTQVYYSASYNFTNSISNAYKYNNYLYFPPLILDNKAGMGIYRFNLNTNTMEYLNKIQSINEKELDHTDYVNYFVIENHYIIFSGWYWFTDNTYDTTTRGNYDLSLISKSYAQDSLIILQGYPAHSKYMVNIWPNNFIGDMLFPLTNVYLYNNNTMYSNLPTYIGNGTTWTKIKG